jgi:hypothetical protein
VDTSTLKVDSTNHRVGIGTATPHELLTTANTAGNVTHSILTSATGTGNIFFATATSGVNSYRGYLQYTQNTNVLEFGINSTSAMTLKSNGLGIGVVPSAWGTYKALQVSNASLWGAANNAYVGANYYFDGSSRNYIANGFASEYSQVSGVHAWFNAPTGIAGVAFGFTQAMTLNASGVLLVGLTTNTGTYSTPFVVSANTGTVGWSVGPTAAAPSNFYVAGTGGAGVYLNGTAATSWTSPSDERSKDIIEPIINAVVKVGSLRAVIGKFKSDKNNTRKPFLIAQDVQSVLPEAVDASNPDLLGVSYTDVIPLLVAAIKELTARVQTLEAR